MGYIQPMQTPALLRPRHDGWTPARQWAFIQALADSGSITVAAQRVGMSREAAYRLRRHPSAADFRTAWDEALAEGWRRVQETAFDRVINGETEVWERDGVTTVRHRPCAPHLVIHMLERAAQEQAATRATANAQLAKLFAERVARARAAILALDDPPTDSANALDATDAPPFEPLPDAETLIMRRLHTLSLGFVEPPDWDAPIDWSPGNTNEKPQNM